MSVSEEELTECSSVLEDKIEEIGGSVHDIDVFADEDRLAVYIHLDSSTSPFGQVAREVDGMEVEVSGLGWFSVTVSKTSADQFKGYMRVDVEKV